MGLARMLVVVACCVALAAATVHVSDRDDYDDDIVAFSDHLDYVHDVLVRRSNGESATTRKVTSGTRSTTRKTTTSTTRSIANATMRTTTRAASTTTLKRTTTRARTTEAPLWDPSLDAYLDLGSSSAPSTSTAPATTTAPRRRPRLTAARVQRRRRRALQRRQCNRFGQCVTLATRARPATTRAPQVSQQRAARVVVDRVRCPRRRFAAKGTNFNPRMRNSVPTSANATACPTSAPVNGRRVCSARPSLVLRLGGLRTDHWVVDRNVTRYLLNPGAPPSALRNNSAGDVIYFNPGHVHQDILMVNGARHDAIYTWVAHQGGGWLAVLSLPEQYRAAVRSQMRPFICSVRKQRAGRCVRRSASRPPRARRCAFRESNDVALAMSLQKGFVLPRPNLTAGADAGDDTLQQHFLRPGHVYNIAMNLPQFAGAPITIDTAASKHPFYVFDADAARADAGVFSAGVLCPSSYLPWVYGAPGRVDDAGSPDWNRAGWVPLAALVCQQ